jgi:hypothetical protein
VLFQLFSDKTNHNKIYDIFLKKLDKTIGQA